MKYRNKSFKNECSHKKLHPFCFLHSENIYLSECFRTAIFSHIRCPLNETDKTRSLSYYLNNSIAGCDVLARYVIVLGACARYHMINNSAVDY